MYRSFLYSRIYSSCAFKISMQVQVSELAPIQAKHLQTPIILLQARDLLLGFVQIQKFI